MTMFLKYLYITLSECTLKYGVSHLDRFFFHKRKRSLLLLFKSRNTTLLIGYFWYSSSRCLQIPCKHVIALSSHFTIATTIFPKCFNMYFTSWLLQARYLSMPWKLNRLVCPFGFSAICFTHKYPVDESKHPEID